MSAAGQREIAHDAHFVEFGNREPSMGEIRLFVEGGKIEYGQPAILVGAREGAAAAPEGGPAVPELNSLAGMIDPDGGFGALAEPQMQHRLLVAPFIPAVMSGGTHGELAALVMIERCKPVLALRKPPFLMLV